MPLPNHPYTLHYSAVVVLAAGLPLLCVLVHSRFGYPLERCAFRPRWPLLVLSCMHMNKLFMCLAVKDNAPALLAPLPPSMLSNHSPWLGVARSNTAHPPLHSTTFGQPPPSARRLRLFPHGSSLSGYHRLYIEALLKLILLLLLPSFLKIFRLRLLHGAFPL